MKKNKMENVNIAIDHCMFHSRVIMQQKIRENYNDVIINKMFRVRVVFINMLTIIKLGRYRIGK